MAAEILPIFLREIRANSPVRLERSEGWGMPKKKSLLRIDSEKGFLSFFLKKTNNT